MKTSRAPLQRFFRCAIVALFACLLLALPTPGQGGGQVVVLPQDTTTRGDWIGAYGTHAFVLCGMRSPHSFSGGKGWPLPISVWTGDPEETVRAWKSSAPTQNNRSALLEPNGLKRTQAVWDDHGETRPLGTGPNLHLKVAVPEGPFLVSMYFFEVDWIQYRDYQIKVYRTSPARELMAETRVAEFLRGKYVRLGVLGPLDVEIVIERGESPNATLGGLFLDRLAPPPGKLLGALTDNVEKLPGDTDVAVRQAENALERLAGAPASPNAAKYMESERAVFDSVQGLADRPGRYLAEFHSRYSRMAERLNQALGVTEDPFQRLVGLTLRYYARRGACDFQEARGDFATLMGEAVDLAVSAQGRFSPAVWLRQGCVEMFGLGRRPEANLAVRAYARAVMETESPEDALESLVSLGKAAIRAGATPALAESIDAWRVENRLLSTDHTALLGSLYYAAGRYGEAREALGEAEPEMAHGSRHRWALVALVSCYLNEDNFEAAEGMVERLRSLYPGSAEITEASYRFAVRRFERGEFREAERDFRVIPHLVGGSGYAQMCEQYLGRIRDETGAGAESTN